jgi:hypothetical protein
VLLRTPKQTCCCKMCVVCHNKDGAACTCGVSQTRTIRGVICLISVVCACRELFTLPPHLDMHSREKRAKKGGGGGQMHTRSFRAPVHIGIFCIFLSFGKLTRRARDEVLKVRWIHTRARVLERT